MRLNCTIDNEPYSINVSSDKPLSKILEENIESFAINNQCKHAKCGNCLVIVNGTYVLSCLIPAFRVNGAIVTTYEGFSKTKFCHDIEKAYAEIGIKPCAQCYASKTLLISSLIEKIENLHSTSSISITNRKKSRQNTFSISSIIADELKLNCCNCMEIAQVEKIIKLVCTYRSKNSGLSK